MEKIDDIKAQRKINFITGIYSFFFLKKRSDIKPITINPIGKWTIKGWNLPIKSKMKSIRIYDKISFIILPSTSVNLNGLPWNW